MKLNTKIVGGAFITLAAIYYWLAARPSNLETTPSVIAVFYLFTFRMFPFADVLWTIAGAALLYRGIDEARDA